MNQTIIKNGFILAALMNFSVLLFSRGFTNEAINDADPVVMSNFGLLMIIMWGIAYLAAANLNTNIKWLAGAFALEKLIYGVVWVNWLSANSLGSVYEKDLFAGLFYSVYGLNDFVFMLFFTWVFIGLNKYNRSNNA
ncbi:hypothetical protein QNI23_005515 [Bermanella sp. WJH001]|uniref:hypothetical protein n=1 Tax=Bermanella sp. WJH001 TaxID=3048005 RepID=UPI0024BEA355|nr:hypothetical protein [Bermanella sp. WJH001]MDJ1539409.1 hypothetical protein [Bermanella sp. WJH001]